MRAFELWVSAAVLSCLVLGGLGHARADEGVEASTLSSAPLPWQRHLDIGPVAGLVSRPASHDDAGAPSPVRYGPGFGIGVGLRVPLFRFLEVAGYFIDAQHAVELPPGSLGVDGTIESPKVHSFSFGARLSPTIALGPRVRAWAGVGGGWGRMEFSRMTATEPGLGSFVIRDRAMSFVELSLSLGASFEIVPRWLRLSLELSGAVVPSQVGTAVERVQTIDAEGKKRWIDGLPRQDGVFTQTVGLLLLL